MSETCENCHGAIGDLESPFVWNEHVVCAACFSKLRAQQELAPPAPARPFDYASTVTASKPTPPARRKVQTIEQTGKVWKAQILLSTTTCIAGTVLVCSGITPGSGNDWWPLGVLVVFFGLIWFLIARIGIWWFHE